MSALTRPLIIHISGMEYSEIGDHSSKPWKSWSYYVSSAPLMEIDFDEAIAFWVDFAVQNFNQQIAWPSSIRVLGSTLGSA
ncbi:hypothetical protein L2E82_28209 [Cichorium intybus]|uniref:Uncharacterized protein n=1 Tax=Cichorium intybus TaxID=13427 RepID=A0ACB9CUZ4_CICIN|nr:hypothetical protein L2E82_28209 [Cichorium intybus]